MSRVKEGRLKKHNCCLTCSVVCFILLVVFVATLYIGGVIFFKTDFMKKYTGGIGFNDALSLARDALFGVKTDPDYTEADLDSFYSDLSSALFLSDKTEDELEYELISEETRATLASSSSVSAAEESVSAAESSYDEDAAYDAFCANTDAAWRYGLLSDEIKAMLTQAQYAALAADTEEAAAVRAKLGLKTYRLSLDSLLGDADFTAEDFKMEDALEDNLSSLAFNFDSLADYDITNPDNPQNEKFTTFSVNGKQASAFINDIVNYMLSNKSPIYDDIQDFFPAGTDLSEFFTVASVTIMNTPLTDVDGTGAFDQKNTRLEVTIDIRLKELMRAALRSEKLKRELKSIPAFWRRQIPKLLPSHYSISMSVYPLAEKTDGREVEVRVNHASDKNARNTARLINGLLKGKNGDTTKTFLGALNNEIVSVFSDVNDKVKIVFVATKDEEGHDLKDSKNNTYSEMQIMTWGTFLSLMGVDDTVSASDILTMLKCLYISEDPSALSLDGAMSVLKSSMASNYGLSETYLDEHNLFSDTDAFAGLLENIDLTSVTFGENEAMRVLLSSEAIASIMMDYLLEAEDPGVSAVGGSGSDLLKNLDPQVSDVRIAKVKTVDGVDIYSLELGISVSLSSMMEAQFKDKEGTSATLVRKILPKGRSYFGLCLYLSESEEDGKLVHKVGPAIDGLAESAYKTRIRINTFTYEQTDSVFDTLNRVMDSLGSETFDIASITSDLEKGIDDAFSSLSDNEFNLNIRLAGASGEEGNGGIYLPSLYELLVGLVNDKDHFDEDDARDVLSLVYDKDYAADKLLPTFTDADADAFLDEINDKYYIKKGSALSASSLFGDGASDLSSTIGAHSIYFKPTAEEAANWTGEKKALYTDDRTAEELRISLTGSRLAALVKDSNLISDDLGGSFGSIEVLGADFTTEDGKTYLSFHLKLSPKTSSGEESSAVKYEKLLPSAIKVSATVLLKADSYTEATPRYSATIEINDADAEKVFLLLGKLDTNTDSTISEASISESLQESIATTFNTLEGKIPLYYGAENRIQIADVFSFLIKETNMKDLAAPEADATEEEIAAYNTAFAAANNTDPDDLAERLRGFGEQISGDAENESIYTWMGSRLKIFTETDDDYIYENMRDAYFIKDKDADGNDIVLDMDTIYSGFKSFLSDFDKNFDLDGENGLFYYDGIIKSLKVSDKALAEIVNEKQSFAGAVTDSSLKVELVSLKLYYEDTRLVIESGVKITFGSGETYAMMPDYFFVIAKTKSDGVGGYTTSLSMNTLSKEVTEGLFCNVSSLSSKGMTSAFSQKKIETTINTAITSALGSFPSGVKFVAFDEDDAKDAAFKDTYGSVLNDGDVYLSFPSVYHFISELFYSTDLPDDTDMQSMILSLHKTNEYLTDHVVLNAKSTSAYNEMGFKGSTLTDGIAVYSDKYLAYAISSLFSTSKINGNLSLADGLLQTIVLRGLTEEEAQGARAEWKSKFFSEEETFVLGDNYLIATAKISLTDYSSGDGISLLPDDLWFTVLADLSAPEKSKALLYDMSLSDMDIFEHILSSNNAAFNIDDIAEDFAELIKYKIDNFAEDTFGVPMQINYRLASDDFIYYEDTSCTTPINASEEMGTKNGVGYIIMSLTDLS